MALSFPMIGIKLKITNSAKGNLDLKRLVQAVLFTSVIILVGPAHAQELLTKPEWLPQLSLGLTEGYDNNLFGVSVNGLQPQGSWFTIFSPTVGFNFAPLLGS